jgi:hypothetical protein
MQADARGDAGHVGGFLNGRRPDAVLVLIKSNSGAFSAAVG